MLTNANGLDNLLNDLINKKTLIKAILLTIDIK